MMGQTASQDQLFYAFNLADHVPRDHLLVVDYCFGIRSERKLCEEVHLNLAYRWFCRLGLEDRVPDHSTFSKNRHGRFRQSDALRFVFESVPSAAWARVWCRVKVLR